MPKKRTGIVFECGHSKEFSWDNCTPESPFCSVSLKKVEHHEKIHEELIVYEKQKKHLREIAEEVLRKEISIGQWEEDWLEIFTLGKKFNFVVRRQGGLYGQSLFTLEINMNVMHSIQRFIWLQTNEGKTNEKGPVWKIIDAVFDKDPWCAKETKKASEYLPELWLLANKIEKALKKIKRKFKLLEDINNVEGSINSIKLFIQRYIDILAKI